MSEFKELEGKTLKAVTRGGDVKITFECDDGQVFTLWHHDDCCETVEIESIVGDLSDVVGTPILLAEEATSEETPASVTLEYEPESQTWTFYKLRTIKGSVDIRWHGTSNGYYSERVSFDKIDGAGG